MSCATLYVLGAGAAYHPWRNQASLLIEYGGYVAAVDFGCSSLPVAARAGFGPEDIDAVVLTHGHYDHLCGLPHLVFLRSFRGSKGLVVAGEARAVGLASELGSGRARRLIASLEAAGLASRLGGRKAMYRVEDDRAPLDALEEAAALLLAPAAHAAPPGCRVLRATLSPGAALSLLSGLYGFTATEERLVYAPVYVGRLESRDGKVYRLVYATGWTGRPLAYRPARSFRA